LEDQYSFAHEDLAFVTTEYSGSKLFGIIPITGVLEMRFVKYPDWDDLSETVYSSLLSQIISFVKPAFKKAFADVYGIDLDSPPLQRILALIAAVDKLQSTTYAMKFGVKFSWELMKEMFGGKNKI
jgi:asparagine synthetase A